MTDGTERSEVYNVSEFSTRWQAKLIAVSGSTGC
jgi:hypothetical protein